MFKINERNLIGIVFTGFIAIFIKILPAWSAKF